MDGSVSEAQQLTVRIEKRFQDRGQSFRASAAFTVGNEIAVIFGPSGAGKTTILECIAGLMTPDRGQISLNERVMFDSGAHRNVLACERRIGYVFQSLALFPHMTAAQNVGYGLSDINDRLRESRVIDALEAFRISHVAARKPAEMSGGERQRVALARSLVTQPRALLLDEPMSALDYHTKAEILHDFREYHGQHQMPVIYVTHAIDEVFAIADRVLKISNGAITSEGKPEEILGEERELLIKNLNAAC